MKWAKNDGIAEAQLHESKDSYEQVKTEYERMESEIEQFRTGNR